VLTESTRRSGDGSLFHARRAATANERSPSDDVLRGTATEPDVADLMLALAVATAWWGEEWNTHGGSKTISRCRFFITCNS